MSNLATLRYLSQSDLLNLGANHSNSFIEAITEGLTLHANKQFVQPLNRIFAGKVQTILLIVLSLCLVFRRQRPNCRHQMDWFKTT